MSFITFRNGINVLTRFLINGTAVTATADELNTLADVTAGTVTANKAIVAGADGAVSGLALSFAGDQTIATNKKVQFRDTGIYINSGADGKLSIVADGSGADDITLSGTVTTNDDILVAATKKINLGDTGTYIDQSADGKILISSDGTGTDDITLSGTVTLDDDLITPTNKKVQFRDSGLFINSGADGKLTISADGVGADDITLAGTVTVSDNVTLAADKNVLLQGTGKLSLDGTTVNATAAELNVLDLSAAGAVVKCAKYAIAAAPTGSEQDTDITLPTNAVVLDVFLKVATAEVTGASKTMMIGTKSGGGGDADGFGAGLSCASTGLVRPGVALDGGSAYFASCTRGALLAHYAVGSGADDRGLYSEFPCTTQGGEVVSFTAGSADWVEFRGSIIILYVEVA